MKGDRDEHHEAGLVIHFFPTWSRDAENTPFGDALRQIGEPYRIFGADLSFRYRSRVKLVLVYLPLLALSAIRSAIASMVKSRPAPNAVVLGSDIQILVFAAARLLWGRRGTRIVLGSFIFTARSKPWVNRIRRAYYRLVLRCTDIAIVHSRLEVDRYRKLFPGVATLFAFVPFGLDIPIRKRLLAEAASHGDTSRLVVSAGRSGRDYATLFAAVAGTDIQLRVICDYAGALPPAPHPANVTVLTGRYGEAYMRELLAADVVVVPLAAYDISVGQMVLIQAMGFGRAVVVTDTPTIRDYVTHEHDALLVPPGNPAALRDAVQRLLQDAELRQRLGQNALVTFDRNHGTPGFLRQMLAVIATAPKLRDRDQAA